MTYYMNDCIESVVKASCGKLFHSDTEEKTKDEKKELVHAKG